MSLHYPLKKTARLILSGFVLLVGVASGASAADLVSGSILVGGKPRSFLLYTPPVGHSFPLVMAFHGGGGDSAEMARITELHDLGESQGFAVVYPQGVQNRITTWQTDLSSHLAFVAALIDYLVANYDVDPTRVYATGISSGGIFSLDLACNMPELFAAIAPVAANFPIYSDRRCQPGMPVSMLFVHGTEDPIIPFDGGFGVAYFTSATQTVEFWAKNNGCYSNPVVTGLPDIDPTDGTTVELRDYGCDVLQYVVNGGGHVWPGMPGPVHILILGTNSQDLPTSEVIWDFFAVR